LYVCGKPYFVPSALAAPCEQLEAALVHVAGLAAAPPFAEVEVEAPPMAVLLAQQALPVAPACDEVDVEAPPMAVLLAQQALLAAAPEQVLCDAEFTTVFSDLLVVAASDWANALVEIINPPIIRPQTIKILEIVFISS
jgi:hypothetical protein